MKDKKKSSTTDVRKSARRASGVTNPFLLPDFDEEHFDPSAEQARSAKEVTTAPSTLWQKQAKGGVSFKKVAKAITKQRKWSSVLKEVRQSDDHTRARGFVAKTEDGEGRLSFNVNAFKPHVQSCGSLPPSIKKTLRKLSWNRTDEEIEVVLQVVKKLKCFDRYPMYVKRELARVLYYDMFEKGRVVIKQGHAGISFYFIVSGSVMVERMEEDRHTGEQHKQVVGEMSEGDAFGELALLHNIRRTATIICKQDSEFLRVDKPDFDELFFSYYLSQTESANTVGYAHNIKSLEHVCRAWSHFQSPVNASRKKIFKCNCGWVLLDLTDALKGGFFFFFFLENFRVLGRPLKSSESLRMSSIETLFTEGDSEGNKTDKVVKKYLTIHVLKEGDFFGVGEDLKKTYIISVGRVHCVLISQPIFMKKERGRTLETLKQKLSDAFLTQKQAFKFYIEDRNWKIYKKKLVDDI
ncbi:unnamed protein product, partial [Porites evermanni]